MDAIIDLNGNKITVTDLPQALIQARRFKNYRSTDPLHKDFVSRQAAYWKDLYQKLLKLAKANATKKSKS